MIRRISVQQLMPGMFVVDLHKSFLDHGFWRQKFLIKDNALIRQLIADGIQEVSIDPRRGRDLLDDQAPSPPRTPLTHIPTFAERMAARPATLSLGEERRRATHLLQEASDTVQELMLQAKRQGQVDSGRLEPVIQRMMESIARNPDALVPLARLKAMDRYTAEHAVATAALMVALGRHLGLDDPDIEHLALGTLLKDIGELSLDEHLIEKRGSLSQGERSQVERHVEESLVVLDATVRLDEASIAVILEHHERFDGSGYPFHRAGDSISLAGRMAAIVDSYDAMTSDRPYRKAMAPAAALTQIYESGGQAFDPTLVASFVHTVGIYPVGSLVRLESGHLGVVEAQTPGQPLQPRIKVIYHAGRREYVTPTVVDLSRRFGNHYGAIVGTEAFERWGISAERWAPC